MSVQELIEQLENFEGDKEVMHMKEGGEHFVFASIIKVDQVTTDI